uniref:Retrovirus-related Pol polyprotein from transposon TNT 1-94 n=1 Tax=Tanacetum cinerariifolium TaxID=118510 RepID=A0A699H487_TANCI|nr:hypothetical protein [Tanacetum cinerariifolium]
MTVVEVPQTLEYRGGNLNAALVLEVENFTNWKKRFMCHIIAIEPQFENIISNGTFILMAASQKKPETDADIEEKVDTSKALDVSLVNTESSGINSKEYDTSRRSGNDAHDDDADIRPIYDEEPTIAKINVFAIGQQHSEQPEFNNE